MAVRAILLMGGMGDRFGSDRPKQFHLLAGKKIYLHTLERFVESGFFKEILLVAPAEWRGEIERECPGFRIVDGGATRQESSYKGIMACPADTEIVVIHDAVRPFVSERILKENIDMARQAGSADTCIPTADTLVYAPKAGWIEAIPIRSHYLRGQTPQSFRLSVIKEAHRHARGKKLEGISDDCRLVKEIGAEVAIVEGDERNIKITTPLDLYLAEQFLQRGIVQEIRVEKRSIAGGLFAITGGTGGIGQAIAKILESEGAKFVLLSPTSKEIALDFRDPKSIKRCFEKIEPLDGLINCAGLLDKAPLQELTEESIDAQIDVNFRGVVHACKHAKLKKGGHIINVASSSYYHGRQEISVYAAAKAAIVNFTQGLAQERPDLIVNVAAPSRTDTAMRKEHFQSEQPHDLLSASEVASAIVDLLLQNKKYSSVVEIRAKASVMKKRCFGDGPGKEFYAKYHDEEWGIPVHDDRHLFEMLILEGAQAGLSWETILKRREGYRKAFHAFDPKKVAKLKDEDLEALLQDPDIIRNRAKVYAARQNAKVFLEIQKEFGSFDRYVWSFVKGTPIKNHWKQFKDIPCQTKESDALSKDLKKRGMNFVGPTIIYAFMQAVGMVNDHTVSCMAYARA